ncbi:hypothetical protein [Janthinobacterium sp.]|uniref:hypothetical protein n=1 Tax=Janthinobacterium sp. TaxID=1871054 RepID=UPI0025B816CE|nr:hypothetical protein [Janthinobacterium sp.]
MLAAERHSLPYGLRLGALSIAPGLGASHRDACLRALALHEPPQYAPLAQAARRAVPQAMQAAP